MRKTTAALYLLPLLVGADLVTKLWAIKTLTGVAEAIPVIPGLSLLLLFNPGVSFGMFAGSPWLVTLMTAAMTIGMMLWFFRSRSEWEYLPLACILAGAASNLIDRLVHGAVTDFLSFGHREAPLFTNNLADIWIGLGVVLLLGGAIIGSARNRSPGIKQGAAISSDGSNGR